MNWLIYIGGWLLFGEFVWGILLLLPNVDIKNPSHGRGYMFSWTLVWVWICWRFIA